MRRIGVFVCHCGTNIAATVDVKTVAETLGKEPAVVYATDYPYMCSEAGQNIIKDAIKEPLEKENITLLDVYLGEDDGEKTLFVTIDSESGVDMDLCVKATHIVDPIIDSLDLDLEEYVLDVGSKGVSDDEEN